MDELLREIDNLKQVLISVRNEEGLYAKGFFNVKELSKYIGLSVSCIYKLTSSGALSFYRPSGKTIFFRKEDIDDWVFSNRIKSKNEISDDVLSQLKSRRLKK